MNNDPILLEAYKKGDQEAYLVLYKKYSLPLRKFLSGGFSFSSQGRICRFRGLDSTSDVDAFVQEAFSRAFASTTRKNYDGLRPFQTYLFSIAKNLVLRECQHRERLINVERIEDAAPATSNFPFCARENYGQSPESHVQNMQLKKLTRDFIKALNQEERTFFSVRFANGNTQEGTATKMSTTRARIKLLEKKYSQEISRYVEKERLSCRA